MPVPSGFSEKTFESYFNAELNSRTTFTFSPGQVDEAKLGFDASFWLDSFDLWRVLPPRVFRDFKRFDGVSKSELDHFAGELSKALPPFQLNLFIQYKLAEKLRTARSSEWEFWEAPYFRYDLTAHQQFALERLSKVGRGRCTCLYAAYASVDAAELFDAAANEKVIDGSNLVEAIRLQDHARYSFIDSGSGGTGHSEPEEIEGRNLEELLSEARKTDGFPLAQNVKFLSKDIFDAVGQHRLFKSALRATFYDSDVENIAVGISFVDSARVIKAFCDAFSVSCRLVSI